MLETMKIKKRLRRCTLVEGTHPRAKRARAGPFPLHPPRPHRRRLARLTGTQTNLILYKKLKVKNLDILEKLSQEFNIRSFSFLNSPDNGNSSELIRTINN